ncbi:MAG: 50S ribosomal protein L29 [bacterium]|nr:50S ribosomal protein L29 [bacterium]
MKLRDLKHERTKNVIELGAELVKSQVRLDGLRFDLVQGKVKNIREIRALRRMIAQLRTLMGEVAGIAPTVPGQKT